MATAADASSAFGRAVPISPLCSVRSLRLVPLKPTAPRCDP